MTQIEYSAQAPKKSRKHKVVEKDKIQPQSWNSPSEADQDPERRRFKPLREPGLQLPVDQEWKPTDFFKLFFSEDSVKTIIKNTEEYAATLKAKRPYLRWYPLTVKEFYAFLGIIIFMGLVDVPTVSEYWDSDGFFGQEFVRNSGICKTRFANILVCLHLCNLEEERENERKKQRQEIHDPLLKLRPLLDELVLCCTSYYVPGQAISIDERMVAFKGRSGMKQYLKDKPTKWGFKLWVLADSTTGYTYKFQIYTGKRLTKTKNGLGHDVVMDLMQSLFKQGYHLYIDNFYSSPTLFRDLFVQGCFCTGTVRDNRTGFPKGFGNPLPKRAERGSSRWFRDGQLVFVKWKDTKEVTVMSTYWKATGTDTVQRKQKRNGVYTVQNINIPPPIVDYNKNMGGVDLSDQLIKYYHVLKKTRKWWKTLFFHFIDVAIVNGYIIYKTAGGTLDQKSFRKQIAVDLVSTNTDVEAEVTTPRPGRPSRSAVRAQHCPIPLMTDLAKSDKATTGRKNCKLCYIREKKQQRTPWQCSKCLVPLCLQLDRNCFQHWHTAACDNIRE